MKIRIVLLSVAFCMAVFSGSYLQAQAATQEKPKVQQGKKSEKDPKQVAKEKDIRKLLVASGAGKMGVQVMGQMLNAFKAQNPSVPSDYWDNFMDEVDPNELIDITIPTYDKHFSHAEIKELIQFYESPIGKKLVEKQPIMMQEGMVAGQKWGMELGRRLQEKLKSDF